MSALPLKPEYRPTLRDVLVPRWRRWSIWRRLLAVGSLVLVVAVALAVVFTFQDAAYSRGGAAPFNFRYRGLYRVAPDPGFYVKVARPKVGAATDFFEVGPLHLPAYSGNIYGVLPLVAADRIRERMTTLKGFDLQGEGRFRQGVSPAYSISYAANWGGRPMYVREILLLPNRAGVRDGIDLILATRPSDTITTDAPVATQGPLQLPLRSVNVG